MAKSPTDASARSLLLTVLGEFVHPRDGEAWTGTLVTALAALGVEEKSARQALARTATEGLLVSARHGRRVRWSLTPAGRQILSEGTERIYGFMRGPRTWDGRWLVCTIAVPESQRQLRHSLRTRLTWLGLGSPSPGLWVVPDASKEPEVRAAIDELGLWSRTYAWVGTAIDAVETTRILAEAWDLDAVEERYTAFVQTYGSLTVTTSAEAFLAQVRLIQDWRRFPFEDPDLPAELLDHDWPGARAAAVFHDRRDRWHRLAQTEWDRLEAQSAQRS